MSLDIEAIKARVEAATPGPWEWEADDDLLHLWKDGENHVLSAWSCPACSRRGQSCLHPSRADADFIAHARADVPALTRQVGRLDDEAECYPAGPGWLLGTRRGGRGWVLALARRQDAPGIRHRVVARRETAVDAGSPCVVLAIGRGDTARVRARPPMPHRDRLHRRPVVSSPGVCEPRPPRSGHPSRECPPGRAEHYALQLAEDQDALPTGAPLQRRQPQGLQGSEALPDLLRGSRRTSPPEAGRRARGEVPLFFCHAPECQTGGDL